MQVGIEFRAVMKVRNEVRAGTQTGIAVVNVKEC